LIRVLVLPRVVWALILILVGVLTFWIGPLIAAIIVKIVGILIVVGGIVILAKEFWYLIRRHL